jgi:hypothetical protein
MELQASPECIISPMRVQTLRETTFFYVTNQPTPFAELDRDLDPLLESLYAAKAQANPDDAGPDIVRYYKAGGAAPEGGPELWWMEVGIPVKAGTQPAGTAQVKVLPPYPCAGVLLWGSLAHIVEAYEALNRGMREAGLEPSGDNREWTYYFESGESPHNLMAIYMGIGQLKGDAPT